MDEIFEGVRVLSLAEQYPGPYATMLLADLGADVILVERPSGGDPSRAYPGVFRSLARNKRSVCLDLKSPDGRNAFIRLAADADVIVEGFRPGTMDRLGVGHEALAAANPRLIYASISGFGQDGPYRNRTAHDLSFQAVSGHLFHKLEDARQTGEVPRIPYGDIASGMFAAFAIASALFARERSGLGTAIDISMADGLVSWMTAYLSPAMAGEGAFEILGEPGYGLFDLADGRRLSLSIAHEDHFWRKLCAILDMNDASDFAQPQRLASANILRSRIAAALAAEPLDHWSVLFDEADIPWSPLNGLGEVIADPHFRNRGLFQTVEGPGGYAERHVIQPVRFSAWPSAIKRPSPGLGEHSEEILGPLAR